MLSRGINHRVHIQRVSFSAKKDTPGWMSYDIYIGIGDSSQHTLCLFLRREIEQAMNRCDHEIQACQHIISIIERPVAQNITFSSLEDTYAASIFFIQTVNLFMLAHQIFLAQPTCIGCRFAMVGET